MAQKGPWNVAREKWLQDRGALPKEERDIVRECKAMDEENFLSSWAEGGCGRHRRRKEGERGEKAREEESRSGKR